MNFPASETSHATALAISSGRNSAMGSAFCWAASQGSSAAASAIVVSLRTMSVATPLGWIVLTRIECGASPIAQPWISATKPRLDAA